MSDLALWQQLLLAVVFVTDLVVLVDLARAELRGWRAERRHKAAPPAGGLPSTSR